MTDLEIESLQQLIDKIDMVIAGLPEFDAADYRAWHAAAQSAFETFLLENGGTTRPKNVQATHIDLAGVSASSTGGPVPAMRNWQVAARKRIAKMRAGAA